MVEECPSTVVDAALAGRLEAAALRAAESVGYASCGTVEFLLAPDGSFYFLEMNTRLQVEHPVTEEVYGVDLAREMISIAAGEPLRLSGLSPRGHAIECRVYAEDPLRGFAPSPGRIETLRLPGGPGVRNDMGVEAGGEVPIDYDPMMGKLIVHGQDRPAAIARLARALSEYEITGVETTLPLFRALVADADFRRGAFDVQWLDRRLGQGLLARTEPDSEDVVLAAVGLAAPRAPAASRPGAARSPWRDAARRELLRSPRPAWPAAMKRLDFILRGNGEPEEIRLEGDGDAWRLTRGGETRSFSVASLPDGRWSLLFSDGRQVCGRARRAEAGSVEVVGVRRARARSRSTIRCTTDFRTGRGVRRDGRGAGPCPHARPCGRSSRRGRGPGGARPGAPGSGSDEDAERDPCRFGGTRRPVRGRVGRCGRNSGCPDGDPPFSVNLNKNPK